MLNANYVRKALEGVFDLPYDTPSMHEVVFSDKIQARKGAKTMDLAKRLIDYGFHPYTTAFPLIVPGALMIEPTESESKAELDRFIDAMIAIRAEIRAIEQGRMDRVDNPLKHAPHPAAAVAADAWPHAYSRTLAAYPGRTSRDGKYWPPVARVDNVYGDRNLFCSCIPPTAAEALEEPALDTSA